MKNPELVLMCTATAQKKKIITTFTLLTFLFVSEVAVAGVAENQSLSSKRVLLLYSYHPTFITSENLLLGVRSVLSKYDLTMDIEYMDSKRNNDKTYLQKFYVLIKEKLQKQEPYDVIIVSDDNALNFVLLHQDDIFKNIPVVFMAVNNIELARSMDDNPFITGVIEAVSLEETIRLAEKLHEQLRSVTFIADDTRSGRADIATVEELASRFPELTFKYLKLGEYSWEEVKHHLRGLDEQSVVIRLAAFRDKNNVVLTYRDSIGLFVQNSPVPVYVLREHGVQHGAFGGDVVSFREQGRRAALIAERILKGEPVSKIKVVQDSPNQYMFDSNALTRFGIDKSKLPGNSKIINQPVSIFEEYSQYVWGVFMAILVLIVFILFLLFEISARKKAERDLKLYQDHLEDIVKSRTTEIVAANKDLESFSYSVSHDLRAPLRTIDGFSQILMDDYKDKLDGEGLAYLTRVRQGAQRMAELIDDILELSRVTRRQIQCETLDISKIAADICDRLRSVYNGRNVDIWIEDQLKSRGDKHLVEVAMENLIDNAFKYTTKNQNAAIKIGSKLIDGKQALYVADNGVGFDMRYYNKLFRAFQRLHTVEEFPGTGIGLASVFRVIDRHGGHIWAEAEQNKGATFYFTLVN